MHPGYSYNAVLSPYKRSLSAELLLALYNVLETNSQMHHSWKEAEVFVLVSAARGGVSDGDYAAKSSVSIVRKVSRRTPLWPTEINRS